jgi:hypothetical protein
MDSASRVKKFYVYEHWRPDTDMPFYVGKGTGRRATRTNRRGRYHDNVAAKLARLGMCFEVRLVHDGLTEQEAFDLEIERIAFWRTLGVKLVNATDGGEGMSGTVHTVEARLKQSLAKRGDKNPAKRPGVGLKISLANKGRKCSDEVRAKMSAARKGRKESDETRAKKGEALRLRWENSEERSKLCAGREGRRPSETTRAKMSAAQYARWEKVNG